MDNDLEEVLDMTADDLVDKTEVSEIMPAFNSSNWFNYVLNQFKDHEKDGNCPTCVGLNRVLQELVGPIVERKIIQCTPPNDVNKHVATVGVRIGILVTLESHPAYGHTVIWEEVADCGRYNTDHPYHLHQSATASTRAEGRAYRKLLGLAGVLSAEEVVNNPVEAVEEWDAPEPITDSQINMIGLLCKRVNINVEKFVNSGENKYTSIMEVNTKSAGKMVQRLNQIQRQIVEKPQGTEGFDDAWRKSF